MILSDKFLQPVKRSDKHSPCCICGQTHSPRFFYDPTTTKFYCAEHTTFEDLDPAARLNQNFLHGVMVSRLAAFPELTDVADLLRRKGPNDRPVNSFYLRVENHPGERVMLTPTLVNWLVNEMLYASADPNQYFLDVLIKEWEGKEYAYLSVNYQTLGGGRFLAIVPASNLYKFLGVSHD